MLLLLVSPFYIASAIAIGLFIAVLVNTQVAAILITFVVTIMPSFLYSGFMVPISNLGRDSKFVAYLFATTYYIDLIRKVMVKGAGFFYVKLDILMLIVICMAFYLVCIKLFKKRLG